MRRWLRLSDCPHQLSLPRDLPWKGRFNDVTNQFSAALSLSINFQHPNLWVFLAKLGDGRSISLSAETPILHDGFNEKVKLGSAQRAR